MVKRGITVLIMVLVMTALGVMGVSAASLGWNNENGRICYLIVSEETGEPEEAKGLLRIGKKTYYFDPSGQMQTGWQSIEGKYYYFCPTGEMGASLGAMYTGLKTIDKSRYYFNANGVVAVGFKQLTSKAFYFSKSTELGERGKALKKVWKKVSGKKRYFNSKGLLEKSKWIDKTYYVDANGDLMTDTVTPDGWVVNSKGKKTGERADGWVSINDQWYYFDRKTNEFKKNGLLKLNGETFYLNEEGVRQSGWQKIKSYTYYFDENGVMLTGCQTIDEKQYYFNTKGRLQKNKTVNGYTTNGEGAVVKAEKKVLVIAGHGQGDPGATSSWGYESNYTRQFGKLIVQKLKETADLTVDFYKDGSVDFDCYQQNVKALGSAGANIASKITGSGSSADLIRKYLTTNPNLPDFWEYDYVLEIHFNAKAAGKDPQGNGVYTGIGVYVNSYKKSYPTERAILNKVKALGFPTWGAGVFASGGLFNARVCQDLGVSYGLLETAFIDDGDDMKFYTKNKEAMAEAVAEGIISTLGAKQ